MDDLEILIGQNKKHNWEIYDNSNDLDVLFHLNSFPSCYVILKNDIDKLKNIDKKILIHCSKLCKENTKYKNLRNLKICYDFVKNIKKGTNTGEIQFKNYNNIIRI